MLTYKKAILLKYLGVYIVLSLTLLSCNDKEQNKNIVNVNALKDTTFNYISYKPNLTDKIISRSEYLNKLEGFWLGQCIANWTGLVTEMDKIGNVGEIKTGAFADIIALKKDPKNKKLKRRLKDLLLEDQKERETLINIAKNGDTCRITGCSPLSSPARQPPSAICRPPLRFSESREVLNFYLCVALFLLPWGVCLGISIFRVMLSAR